MQPTTKDILLAIAIAFSTLAFTLFLRWATNEAVPGMEEVVAGLRQ
jgi:hypothetical protein